MKKIEFKTSKGEFVVVELNEREQRGIECNPMLKLISRIPDITEEQAKDIIKFGHYCPHNYTYHKGYWDVETNTFKEHNTAIDSLNSLLEASGVMFENTSCSNCQNGCPVCCGYGHLYDGWNKQQTYLFKKI